MAIYKGSTKIGTINVGGSNIKEVYKGSTKVMSASSSTPDGFVFRELSDDGVLSLPTGELPVFDWVTEIGNLGDTKDSATVKD